MNLILSLLLATSATTASKTYLAIESMLAGTLIKYCEHGAPKSCQTIDRRNETIASDPVGDSDQLALKLSKIAPEFRTLTIDFLNPDEAPGGRRLQIKFTQDPKKKTAKK
ncbi:MAG TPA: hypothetical protein VE954_21070 [Oligoflexus sp.]|uniref:hypothetical protein n=1 Tax=Oligoflexus sp. TaxID=1971216 RepID=UPI002D4AFFD0|nr:hypothetical protein [Oligoflexus sp.]HYX35597.1 hypothetical protein [Oligoflexus sp.]